MLFFSFAAFWHLKIPQGIESTKLLKYTYIDQIASLHCIAQVVACDFPNYFPDI